MSAVSHAPVTPLRFLERSAEVYPDKVAIVHGDRRWTYREFAGEAIRLARALQASGIEAGDRVAYLCPNIPELLIAHFAVPLAGAVLVAINSRLAGQEVRYICEHSGAKLLVVDSELRSVVAPLRDQLGAVREIVTVTDPVAELAVSDAPDGPGYEDLLERGSDESLAWAVEDELATITINYTSGSAQGRDRQGPTQGQGRQGPAQGRQGSAEGHDQRRHNEVGHQGSMSVRQDLERGAEEVRLECDRLTWKQFRFM